MDRHKVITANYLILEQDNQLLMLRRCNTGYHDGDYSLVAGHGDKNETPRQCMIREANEEAGIIIKPEDLELVHVMSRVREDKEEAINFFWKCSKWDEDITNMEPEKCDDLSWFSKNNLPENLVPELKIALPAIFSSEVYSEFNWN